MVGLKLSSPKQTPFPEGSHAASQHCLPLIQACCRSFYPRLLAKEGHIPLQRMRSFVKLFVGLAPIPLAPDQLLLKNCIHLYNYELLAALCRNCRKGSITIQRRNENISYLSSLGIGLPKKTLQQRTNKTQTSLGSNPLQPLLLSGQI